MMAQPKTKYFRAGPDTVAVIPAGGELAGDLFIECELVSPPSMKGRTVDVRIPAGQVPAILKAAREAAIRIRVTPEGSS